jgi:RsiW-degrading membrane proteinase PrsW (M82 family)
MGAAGAATASAPASAGDVPSSIASAAFSAIVPLPLGRDATLAEVNNRLRTFAIILTAIVLVFAVVSGLQVLYMPNAAFGWWDVAVAFLWGAGLHAVAGQTFQGLQAFAQQLR